MIEWIGGIYNIPIRPSQLVLTYLNRKIKQAAVRAREKYLEQASQEI
jgi:hypothetical protein